MRGRAALCLAGVCALAPGNDYLSILSEYTTGDADSAVIQMTALDRASVEMGAGQLPQRPDEKLLLAAAAIHSEVALVLRPTESATLALSYQLTLARDIVQYGELHAKARHNAIALAGSGAQPLRTSFRRAWYIAAIRHFEIWGRFAQADELLKHARELYPRDAQILLLDGIFDEAVASPRSAGVSARARRGHLSDAENKLRAALQADPASGESRLRLGRVLGQVGKLPEAGATLEPLADSRDQRLAYLSRLFLGAIAIESGDDARGARWYAAAAEAMPGAQSALVGRSELFYRAGDGPSAASVLPAALERGDVDDPWWRYVLGEYWLMDASRGELRALARQ
jgi:tetratricopeptide (TPR) repeat protein